MMMKSKRVCTEYVRLCVDIFFLYFLMLDL